MSLIVEDGSIVSGAESYLSVADADTYWSNLNVTNWDGSTANKEAALRAATQFIDSTYRFKSYMQTTTQSLQWPRTGFYGDTGRYYAPDEIPACIKSATAELAREWVTNGAFIPPQERGGDIKRVKAGSVEVEYMDKAPSQKTFNYIGRLLSDVTDSSANGISTRLKRV